MSDVDPALLENLDMLLDLDLLSEEQVTLDGLNTMNEATDEEEDAP